MGAKTWRDAATMAARQLARDGKRWRTNELIETATDLAVSGGVIFADFVSEDIVRADGSVLKIRPHTSAGNVTGYVFPRLTDPNGEERHQGSRVPQAGVYCDPAEAERLAEVVRPTLKKSLRKRAVTMFAFVPPDRPSEIAVFTRVGDTLLSSMYRAFYFPADLIRLAADRPAGEVAGLSRGGAWHILPDALIESDRPAEAALCQSDPEYAMALALALRVAADARVPDAETTKQSATAAKADRDRRARAERLLPVLDLLTEAGVGDPLFGQPDSADAARRLNQLCLTARARGLPCPRRSNTDGLVYDVIGYDERLECLGDWGPERTPNPEFEPPADMVWGRVPHHGSGTFGAWVTAAGEHRYVEGGRYVGDTARRCWDALADYCGRYADAWAAGVATSGWAVLPR